MKAIAIPQNYRNQLSLLSWVVAALCAWLLFLAATASAHAHVGHNNGAGVTKTVIVSAPVN